MSRSKKKTPISGITTAKSEKENKRESNRHFRRKIKENNKQGKAEEIISIKEVSNIWEFDKDGKIFHSNTNTKQLRK